mgnify:FL=1
MGFIEGIKECLSEAGLTAEPLFRAVLFGDDALYLEGVRSIKSYSESKVELRIKKGGLTVLGEGLFIKKYCAGDLAICGKILSVKRD